MEAIKVENFSCYYKLDKGGYVTALDKVSFSVESGEMLTVIGEAGGGKTTLLRCMLGLNDYTSGTLLMGGISADALDVADNNMAYVRQEIVLYPQMTVYENIAFIAGGETVVKLTGKGKGGRNQELALSAAPILSDLPGSALFSVGSDGTDGPTDAAGGYVDWQTERTLKEQGVSIHEVLANNDAYHALQKCDGLIITGPTGTNVNDVAVCLYRTK